MESFYRRATEIQTLLQSSEPPLELQVQCEYLNTFAFVFNSSGVQLIRCNPVQSTAENDAIISHLKQHFFYFDMSPYKSMEPLYFGSGGLCNYFPYSLGGGDPSEEQDRAAPGACF